MRVEAQKQVETKLKDKILLVLSRNTWVLLANWLLNYLNRKIFFNKILIRV